MTWQDAHNILCVRLDQMGDVLMTTPALRAVRGQRARTITLVTSSSGAVAARHIPEVSDILVYDPPWMKHSDIRTTAELDRDFITELRSRRFDAGIIFNVFTQSALPAALMLYLAEVPLRLGSCRENPYSLLTDWVQDNEPSKGIRHEAQRQIELVEAIGWKHLDERLSLSVPQSAVQRIASLTSTFHLSNRWVVVHPGASAPSRRYPPHLFTQAIALLMKEGWDVIFTGSEQEAPLIESIRSGLPRHTVSLAGALPFAELAALIQHAPLVLTNNTGPSHIAAAVGTPVVTLYALTNPQHTPWKVPSIVLSHDVPCRNCFKSSCPEGHQHCLSLIAPHRVAQACNQLFESTRQSSYGETYAYTRN